jgi:hypothetical protein
MPVAAIARLKVYEKSSFALRLSLCFCLWVGNALCESFMETDLICLWLELPPGSWPPDHYTLLGLPPDLVDSDQIEARVQERIHRVRHFQLTHPELATEAMNRLAQALLCLSNPGERAEYNQHLLGVGAAEVSEGAKPDRPQSSSEILPIGVIVTQPAMVVDTEPQPPPKPAILPVVKSPPIPPTDRKPLLETIALVRRAILEWQIVGSLLFTPNRSEEETIELRRLARRLPVLSYELQAVGLPWGEPDQPGFKIVSLGHSLTGADAEMLAQDWNAGLEWLRAWRKQLKGEIGRQRRRGWPRRWLRKLGRFYLNHPGPFLFLLGWLSLDLASPRLREVWRGQTVVLAFVVIVSAIYLLRRRRARP